MLKKIRKPLIVCIIIGVICAGGYWCYGHQSILKAWLHRDTISVGQAVKEVIEEPEPVITTDYINSKLDLISDLSTAKITYGCMCELKAGSIPLITKKGFSMYYEATVKAGIDISQISSEVVDDKVIVRLPPAEIQDCNISPSSIEFYDIDNSLFNKTKPEDVPTAMGYAEKDVYYQATTDQLLDMAETNAVNTVSALLSGYVEDREVEVIKGERESIEKVQPPFSSSEVVKMNYKEVVEAFKKSGFMHITEDKIADIKIGVLSKEGEVESVRIGDKSDFKKSNVFDANAEVVVTYHIKKSK